MKHYIQKVPNDDSQIVNILILFLVACCREKNEVQIIKIKKILNVNTCKHFELRSLIKVFFKQGASFFFQLI